MVLKMSFTNQDIRKKFDVIQRVFVALEVNENAANQAVPQASDNDHEDAHLNYLAARMQREKLEKIRDYIAIYRLNMFNNYLWLSYSQSFRTFIQRLPDNPQEDLSAYLNNLPDKIGQEDPSNFKAWMQYALHMALIFLLGGVFFTMCILFPIASINPVVFLGVCMGCSIPLALLMSTANMIRDQWYDLVSIQKYLKADCLPNLTASNYELKLTANSNLSCIDSEISVYLHPDDTDVMMCGVRLFTGEGSGAKRLFEAVQNPGTGKVDISALKRPTQNSPTQNSHLKPGIEVFPISISDQEICIAIKKKLKFQPLSKDTLSQAEIDAIFEAINKRKFSRELVCESGTLTEDRLGIITSKRLLSHELDKVKARFFCAAGNPYSVEAVQKTIQPSS